MKKIDDYLAAATRENTRRSYLTAIRHFEVEWGGFLPATADSIARYLADHAEVLAITTLRQRLAALAQWHVTQGFPDPTKAPVVRKVLKGIQALHPAQEKQATPLQIDLLTQVVNWLDRAIELASERQDTGRVLRHARNKAMLLLGFWRGFRGDELVRLQVEHVEVVREQGMSCYLPQSKGDRRLQGRTYKVPMLSQLCPVAAYNNWVTMAGLSSGPVFRGIDRWGRVRETGLHINSLLKLMRSVFSQAGLNTPESFSSHSLRRGFANWANSSGWDVKTLMEYVGWKDVKSAMRYIDGTDPFQQQRIEKDLSATPPSPASASPTAVIAYVEDGVCPPPPARETVLELDMALSRFSSQVRGLTKAHRLIEEIGLSPFRMQRLDKEGTHYQLTITSSDEEELEDIVINLLDDIHRIADNHQCFLDATLHDPTGGRHWD
ncbi:site-specific integrase [Croceicoccus sp. YJ47]|uniref:site-specific integrase n=1 Tax=Croceicoccus sp. YJ47 TaxID=2798724 RepID=UPI0019218D4D|nr:site-specific integrase [Croceicoccus sp. YJ47]QQN75538.1 site-specific integrase [Croceicoccus sp. YJ47]